MVDMEMVFKAIDQMTREESVSLPCTSNNIFLDWSHSFCNFLKIP